MTAIDLTEAEIVECLSGLYMRLSETKSYIRSARAVVDAHAGHGEECCGQGVVERQRESLGYLKERRDAIKSAIAKFEAIEAGDAPELVAVDSVPLAGNSMRHIWKPGERVELVGYTGSYPDPSKDRPATVVAVEDYLSRRERLIVHFDGDPEPQAINPDVMRHIRGEE